MYVHSEQLKELPIAIVDDQEVNVYVLERMLQRAGYRNTFSTTDSRCALALAADCHADLIILDLHMPEPDGFQILETMAGERDSANFVPVLVVTADITPSARLRAVGLGAKEFLTKPVDAVELLMRTHNLLETRFLLRGLYQDNRIAHAQALARVAQSKHVTCEALRSVALAFLPETEAARQRIARIATLCGEIAAAMGVPPDEAETIQTAGLYHEAALRAPASDLPVIRMAREMAEDASERWDGHGQPRHLRGDQIPLPARIAAAACFFERLTGSEDVSKRTPPAEARGEVLRQSALLFDPAVAAALGSLGEIAG